MLRYIKAWLNKLVINEDMLLVRGSYLAIAI